MQRNEAAGKRSACRGPTLAGHVQGTGSLCLWDTFWEQGPAEDKVVNIAILAFAWLQVWFGRVD